MALSRLSSALLAAASLILLADCKTTPETDASALQDAASDSAGAPAGRDNVAYAQRCLTELGLDPVKMTDLSCLAGTPVPITFGERGVDSGSWTSFVQGGRRCDDPQWLTDGCHPYDFVQMQTYGNVQVLLNCRQKYFPDEDKSDPALAAGMNKWERFLAYADAVRSGDAAKIEKYRRFAFVFNDMGVIMRNKQSGKVCYFTYFDADFFGGFVPAPNRAVKPDDAAFKAVVRAGITAGLAQAPLSPAQKETIQGLADDPMLNVADYRKTSQEFYFPPSDTGNCASCHVYGGFKWSPFITQVEVLPSLMQASRAPHLPVGSELAAELRGSGAVEVKVAGDSTCTSCHRLSSQGRPGERECNHFEVATGHFAQSTQQVYTAQGLAYPHRSWMPLDHGVASEQEYTNTYKAGIDSARCCCQHPTATGCTWRRYGPTQVEVDTTWRTGVAPPEIETGFHLGNDTAVDCSLGHVAAPPPPAAGTGPGTNTGTSTGTGTGSATPPVEEGKGSIVPDSPAPPGTLD